MIIHCLLLAAITTQIVQYNTMVWRVVVFALRVSRCQPPPAAEVSLFACLVYQCVGRCFREQNTQYMRAQRSMFNYLTFPNDVSNLLGTAVESQPRVLAAFCSLCSIRRV